MVVHTPSKLDVLRQTAAERRAASDDAVPPAVAAAAAAALETGTVAGTASLGTGGDAAAGGFELPADDPLSHEFAAWNGITPPGIEVNAEIHSMEEIQQEEHVNVTTRRNKAYTNKGLTPDAAKLADEDKISVTGSLPDNTTAPPSADKLPELNPFTPEWFAQLVGAAASAATSAAASAAVKAVSASPTPM